MRWDFETAFWMVIATVALLLQLSYDGIFTITTRHRNIVSGASAMRFGEMIQALRQELLRRQCDIATSV